MSYNRGLNQRSVDGRIRRKAPIHYKVNSRSPPVRQHIPNRRPSPQQLRSPMHRNDNIEGSEREGGFSKYYMNYLDDIMKIKKFLDTFGITPVNGIIRKPI